MITTLLAMDEIERTGRREAIPHDPAALRALADRIQSHAELVRTVANQLEKAGQGRAVGLNFTRSVDAGLIAIRNLVSEVERKIDNKKFHKITDARPPESPPKNDPETKSKAREAFRTRKKP